MTKVKFSYRLRNFIVWKLEEFAKRAVKWLSRVANVLFKTKSGSFKERQIVIFMHCILYFPLLRLKNLLSVNDSVESHYDRISGSYVKNLTKNERKKWGVVNGEVQQNTYAQYCIDGMKERMQYMEKNAPFENMLEVGAGELTTFCSLIDVMTIDQPDFFAIDLSLNRLRHGRAFAQEKKIKINIAKASAFALPYQDNSFDVVFTSHCLEWMPKHMFKQAVDEICRVSKKHVFLFEPTYEYAGFLQKMKMRTYSYMRGLVPYLKNKKHIDIKSSYVMKHSYNAFNQTSCHHLIVDINDGVTNSTDYACPKSHSKLELKEGSYFCFESQLGFPIFDDIPVLDLDYSLQVSQVSNSPKSN